MFNIMQLVQKKNVQVLYKMLEDALLTVNLKLEQLVF
jgi:hypothetical protein